VVLFFPETTGRTLEEIDAVFGDQKIDHALDPRDRPQIEGDHEKGQISNASHEEIGQEKY